MTKITELKGKGAFSIEVVKAIKRTTKKVVKRFVSEPIKKIKSRKIKNLKKRNEYIIRIPKSISRRMQRKKRF